MLLTLCDALRKDGTARSKAAFRLRSSVVREPLEESVPGRREIGRGVNHRRDQIAVFRQSDQAYDHWPLPGGEDRTKVERAPHRPRASIGTLPATPCCRGQCECTHSGVERAPPIAARLVRHRRHVVSRLLSHVRAACESPASQWRLEKRQRKDRQEQLPNSDHRHMAVGIATKLCALARQRSGTMINTPPLYA